MGDKSGERRGELMSVFSRYKDRYQSTQEEVMSLQDYLELCKKDKSVYATAAERMLMAIGEPQLIETSKDIRLSRIFSNKVIKRYPAFSEFYGMEEAVENIVSFRHAAQGLEERKPFLFMPLRDLLFSNHRWVCLIRMKMPPSSKKI